MKILITGIAGVLGNYLCDKLTACGNQVIGTDIVPPDQIGDKTYVNLVQYYEFDLLRYDLIPEFIHKVFTDHPDLSGIINNAGLKLFRKLDDFNPEEFRNVITINFLVPAAITRSSFKYLENNNFGRIINIASNAGFEGYEKGSAYCSSKGALHLFTKSVSQELYGNITINTISPETFSTPDLKSRRGRSFGSSVVDISRIFKQIQNTLSSNQNGSVIPILCLKTKIRYFVRDFFGSFSWLNK